MSYLRRLSDWLLVLGIPGLFVMSVLDSAAIPMVGGPDAFILLLSWRRPAQFLWIAITATIGSTLGCLILYRFAKSAGKLALARLAPSKRAWIEAKMATHAIWAVFLSVAAAPPFPTKPVVMAAGAFQIPVVVFTITVLVGRLLHYAALAWLGARFGNDAVHVIKAHYVTILLALAGIIVLMLLIHVCVTQRQRRNERSPLP